MSRLDRLAGLARSLAVYHGIPLRQRRLRGLYRQFAGKGDLVFDIGAHAGNRVRGFASLGCRVVALEPQPDFARLLRAMFARWPDVQILEAAASNAVGRAALSISERTPTVTTLADRWRHERAGEPGFAGVRWNRHVDVETTTLDRLIAQYGVPAFIKIDVEGAEPAVLDGLTRAVPALSFEYLPDALDQAGQCAARLASLGTYRFNWSAGESYRLSADAWLTERELLSALSTPAARQRSGDVYARLVTTLRDET